MTEVVASGRHEPWEAMSSAICLPPLNLMSTLVIAEHDNDSLKVATLNAVAAAQAMGADPAYSGTRFIATEEANAVPHQQAAQQV